MGYILKFRSRNLYTIIIVTKIKKRFLKKKEKVKGFFIFTTMLSLKQVKSNYGIKKGPMNNAVVGLNFLIVWILCTINMLLFFQFELKMAVHAALMKKKSVMWTTFDAFLRKISFLMFLQEELASLLSTGRPFSGDFEG